MSALRFLKEAVLESSPYCVLEWTRVGHKLYVIAHKLGYHDKHDKDRLDAGLAISDIGINVTV